MSGTSVGLGVGITIGILAVLAIVLVIVGLCTSSRRTGDVDRELQHRRDLLREQQEREQTEWRTRRLRDVVLVLIDRGEAQEGVPLAFQLAEHSEVHARRRLRDRRARWLAETDDVFEEDAQYGPEGQAILHKSLEQLLEGGRPQDAEPGPDIMQLLLDGAEIHSLHLSEADENSSEFESISEDSQETPGAAGTSAKNSPRNAGPPAAQTPSAATPAAAVTPATTEAVDGDAPAIPQDPAEARRAQQQAAILRELHAEQRRRTRRRKTADEIYGEPVPYVRNPYNDAYVQVDAELDTPAVPQAHEEPGSPLKRFFSSPMTPFRRRRATGTSGSAFDGRSPAAAAQDPTTPSGGAKGKKRGSTAKNTSGSPALARGDTANGHAPTSGGGQQGSSLPRSPSFSEPYP